MTPPPVAAPTPPGIPVHPFAQKLAQAHAQALHAHTQRALVQQYPQLRRQLRQDELRWMPFCMWMAVGTALLVAYLVPGPARWGWVLLVLAAQVLMVAPVGWIAYERAVRLQYFEHQMWKDPVVQAALGLRVRPALWSALDTRGNKTFSLEEARQLVLALDPTVLQRVYEDTPELKRAQVMQQLLDNVHAILNTQDRYVWSALERYLALQVHQQRALAATLGYYPWSVDDLPL